MNTLRTTATPPMFSETHATTIVDAALQHPDADGLLVEIPNQHMLSCVSTRAGVVVRWVTESPTAPGEFEERFKQLSAAGLNYVCLSMLVDRLVPMAQAAKH